MTAYHPDVLACHTQFGGDLDAMQALYDRPDHLAALEAQSAQIAELQAEMVRAWNAFGGPVCESAYDLGWLPHVAGGSLSEQIAEQTAQLATAEAQIADLKRALDTARHDAMEEAAKLLEEGYDREVGKPYRSDGAPSKHDMCPHGNYGWEECEQCAIAAIRRLSASPLSQGGQK